MPETTPPATSPADAIALVVTCGYPGCENEPRPARTGRGSKPRYCEQPDPETGRPHTALTAFRRKQELRREAGLPTPDDHGVPVTTATTEAAELYRRARATAASQAADWAAIADRLDTITDPQAAEAEIETVRTRASAELVRETERRQAATAC